MSRTWPIGRCHGFTACRVLVASHYASPSRRGPFVARSTKEGGDLLFDGALQRPGAQPTQFGQVLTIFVQSAAQQLGDLRLKSGTVAISQHLSVHPLDWRAHQRYRGFGHRRSDVGDHGFDAPKSRT